MVIIELKHINCLIIAAISILSGIISSILFHFFWFKNTKAFTWIIIFSILIGIYLTSIIAALKEYHKDKLFLSVMALNYGIFSLTLFAVYKILYYLCRCCGWIIINCCGNS